MKLVVVIPSYNESKRISEVLDGVKEANLPIIVVDDGSSDRTWDIAKRSGVLLIRHKINLGKGAALKTGCNKAFSLGYEGVILMDSDGQHKSTDLYKFKDALQKRGVDIAFGSRNLSLGVPFIRFVSNKFASFLISVLFNIYLSDLLCGFRAITKDAYEKIDWESTGYDVETEMVVKTGKLGLKYCEVPVETVYYDKFKGVTILDAFNTLFSVLKWKINL